METYGLYTYELIRYCPRGVGVHRGGGRERHGAVAGAGGVRGGGAGALRGRHARGARGRRGRRRRARARRAALLHRGRQPGRALLHRRTYRFAHTLLLYVL